MRSVVLLAALGGLLAHVADAASDSEPHPHKGKIPRLTMDGKPKVKLSKKDWEKVEAGNLWMSSKEENKVGRGIGISDIAAPVDIVWGQISDLEAYVGKVPMLKSLKVYDRKKKGSEVIEKATYLVKVIPGYNFEYYVEHHADKKKKILLFYLDYDRFGDFNDMQGKWVLEEHPTKKGWTRVYYQCDLMLWGYAPQIVKTLLTSKGLQSAIAWVKRESEKRAPKTVEAFAGGPAVWGERRAGARPHGPPSVQLHDAAEGDSSVLVQCAELASVVVVLAASRRLASRGRRARGSRAQ